MARVAAHLLQVLAHGGAKLSHVTHGTLGPLPVGAWAPHNRHNDGCKATLREDRGEVPMSVLGGCA